MAKTTTTTKANKTVAKAPETASPNVLTEPVTTPTEPVPPIVTEPVAQTNQPPAEKPKAEKKEKPQAEPKEDPKKILCPDTGKMVYATAADYQQSLKDD